MDTSKENITVIDPGQKGIVYESYSKFERSIFCKVYAKAIDLTAQIIERNRELQKSKNHGNDFRNKEQVDNIITFIGRRGTGKTSAMLSFMEGLKDHYKLHNVIPDQQEQFNFISLEWIDASLMEENEDIFETILAKMFGELLRKNENNISSRKSDLEYDYRNLYQQFENIYKRVVNLKNKAYDEEILVNVLKNHSRSTEIRTDFGKLVKDYIRFLEDVASSGERSYNETYLVIAIDDIDLNAKKGYDILETIHRYLMVPGVIVLVAVNYEEMLLCCEKRYIEFYRDLPEIVIGDIGKRAIQMSEEYLEKVLPPYMRVYLPSLKKTDFELKENRKIEINGKQYSIKKGIFRIIWEKTHVFYDTGGKKRHFMEPVTLRNMSTNFQLYNNMKTLPEQTDENFRKVYDENYYKVIDDILFRFACESLPNKEYRLFMKWSEETNIRRGPDIVEQVISEFQERTEENYGNKRDVDINKFVEDYKVWGYSYGELLRSLYCMSRKTDLDKKLVHVLLAQYTVVFSRVFELYKIYELKSFNNKIYNSDNKDDSDNKKSSTPNRDTLVELMGQSVGGSWAKYVLPSMKISDKENAPGEYWSAYRYRSSDKITLCNIKKDSAIWKIIQKIKDKESLEKEWQEILKVEEIEVIKVWMFFFSSFTGRFNKDMLSIFPPSKDIEKKDDKSDKDDKSGKDGKSEVVEEYRIGFNGGGVEFNIFNFVQNSFNYYEVVQNYYISIFKALCKYANITMEDIDIQNRVNQIMQDEIDKENTFLYRFKAWNDKYGGLALPIYNFDITYNLIKRLIISCKKENVGYIKNDEAYDYICSLFTKIKKNLKEQDNGYKYEGLITGTENLSNFAECFSTCPIVECINSQNDERIKYKAFMDEYAKISYSASNNNQDQTGSIVFYKND